MSEQRFQAPTPREAQMQAHALIEFGIATSTIYYESVRTNKNGVVDLAFAAVGEGIFDKDVSIRYEDFSLSNNAIEPSDKVVTDTSIRIKQGTYEALIDDNHYSESRKIALSSSSVKRGGYGTHEFSEKNKMKAGALITSLAAKHMAREALNEANDRIATINAATAVYTERISAKTEVAVIERVEDHIA